MRIGTNLNLTFIIKRCLIKKMDSHQFETIIVEFF